MNITDLRPERPLNRSPITILIDDPTPGINPLFYFAKQVPRGSVDYHYFSKKGEWYFDVDRDLKFPIPSSINPEFVREFAEWVRSTDVKGKISVIPYPAGLGRVDKSIKGVADQTRRQFIKTLKRDVLPKFSISSELLTHTNALDLKTKKLKKVSEHDWSQKQDVKTLSAYISYSLEILKAAGLSPSGVTSPCNFGMFVEAAYANAALEASKNVLGSNVAWYFLHVDSESLNVPHRLMHLDRERGEAVVSLVGSMNDPFWRSQLSDTSQNGEDWVENALEPIISPDAKSGRIPDLVSNGSCVTLVTHWQSLYGNGSRFGLDGLREAVKRINSSLGPENATFWMNCEEIANYVACSSSCLLRLLHGAGEETVIEVTSPFNCEHYTFSFIVDKMPNSITIRRGEEADGFSNTEGQTDLMRVDKWVDFKDRTFTTIDTGDKKFRVFCCLGELKKRKMRNKKSTEYYREISII